MFFVKSQQKYINLLFDL